MCAYAVVSRLRLWFTGVRHINMIPKRIEMPVQVEEILGKLREHGYEAFAVGGCVRDAILGRTEISSEEVPMKSKRDLLSALSAVAYGSENGYEIQAEDGYLETQQMLLRRFKIERRKEK